MPTHTRCAIVALMLLATAAAALAVAVADPPTAFDQVLPAGELQNQLKQQKEKTDWSDQQRDDKKKVQQELDEEQKLDSNDGDAAKDEEGGKPRGQSDHLHKSDQDANYKELHVVLQYYEDRRPARRAELRAALAMNLNNKHINFIHVLLEKEKDWPGDMINSSRVVPANYKEQNRGQPPKVFKSLLGHRITFKDGIEYAEKHLAGKMVLLINADVFFDDTVADLHYIRDLKQRKMAMVLSRYEHHRDGSVVSHYCAKGSTGVSADAFIWTPPLKCKNFNAFKRHLSYPLGTWGGENRWMFEMHNQCGLKIINPCFSVILHHVHDSEDYLAKEKIDHSQNNPAGGGFMGAKAMVLSNADFAVPRESQPHVVKFNNVVAHQLTYEQMLQQGALPNNKPPKLVFGKGAYPIGEDIEGSEYQRRQEEKQKEQEQQRAWQKQQQQWKQQQQQQQQWQQQWQPQPQPQQQWQTANQPQTNGGTVIIQPGGNGQQAMQPLWK